MNLLSDHPSITVMWLCLQELKKLVDKLERVKKLAARIILGAPMTARTAELYKTLNWSTLDQRRRYHTANLRFQSFKWSIPSLATYRIHLNYLYIRLNVACIYNSYRIYIPFVRTSYHC